MSPQPKTGPFGSWSSPISADMAAGKSLRFGSVCADGQTLYWSEGRPEEGGRSALMCALPDGAVEEILPAPWSARSKVHEYGGGEFTVQDGICFFVDAETQDLYALEPGLAPRRLSQASDTRFADMELDARHQRLIVVAERVDAGDGHGHPENFLSGVSLSGEGEPEALVAGHDFYANPRVSHDGKSLAFLSWDLPHMPWEAAALFIAAIADDGSIGAPTRVAGGVDDAVFQPEWTSDGRLLFVADANGWGNLHEWNRREIRTVEVCAADLLRPLWVFGMRSYALLDDARAAAVYFENGAARLKIINIASGESTPVETEFLSLDAITATGDGVGAVVATDTAAPAVARIPLGDGETHILRASMDAALAPDDISAARMITLDGDDASGGAVHALYYPPASASWAAPEGALPPVIVTVHGGPTGYADRGFKIKTQYWTSRGFGVCDVDYSGSAGYGRAYRERLDGQWGIRDVADVAAAARYLAGARLADPERIVISGGSAGGFTVLLALATHNLFAAGACAYAVSDLAQLQRITHKFEAGYLYRLTGTSVHEHESVFAARSPVNQAGEISAPVIFFQGADDKVVPPAQTRSMAQTLKENGVPVASFEFAGEGHGFRQGETIARVLQLEYAFYCRTLGLESADTLPEFAIENFETVQ
ncbi:MAG: prolyl oligopeptidase family serine peptidase [Hyphomicrobiales bacterium]|nr:prolyl oligopeptidase family serine peptidase [Hyphomicrobiales bacterium]